MEITRSQLAKMIDLMPKYKFGYVTKEEVVEACHKAKSCGFAAVFIPSFYISLASELLEGTDVRVATGIRSYFDSVIEELSPEAKVFLTKDAIKNGARELDMMMNIGAFKSGNYELAKKNIEKVVSTAKSMGDIVVKVIIETGYLTDDEISKASLLVKESGADFVKTCTGFGARGATVHDIQLIRRAVGNSIGVKAAGGIRTTKQAMAMIRAGANRIGTSNAIAIVEGVK